MNYTIIWMPAALQELAAIWLAANDRNAVNRAANAIDQSLAASPHTTGVLIFDTLYEFTHPPLGVEYEVIDADRHVFVLTVWDTARGRPAPTGN